VSRNAGTSGTADESVTNIWNQDWWNASEPASWSLNSKIPELKEEPERA
jgi:hypothetical protein